MKIWIQLGFVLVAVLVFVIRAVWAAQQEREEDELFRGDPQKQRTASPPRRHDPNSPWDDHRQQAAVETEQRESMRQHRRSFADRVSHDVDTSDVQSRIESELHRKFDERHVGSLESASDTTAPGSTELSAAGVAPWSNDPARIRDAFILREILARPEQRWSETT